MQVQKNIKRLQSDLESAAGALSEVDSDDEALHAWAQESLMPALESIGMALGELADETEENFAETGEVIAEILEDEEEEGYLIPAELTAGAIELLNLARGIIQAFVDRAPVETLDAQIAAFETGSAALVEKMTELTEDASEDEDPDDPDPADDDSEVDEEVDEE